jgi:ABC-type amino acid transport substrate-binding protein
LKKKDFKLAGVPHYKNLQISPIQVLNAILNGNLDALMLMNPFLVQVLLPAHKKLQIDALMNTLKESSM